MEWTVPIHPSYPSIHPSIHPSIPSPPPLNATAKLLSIYPSTPTKGTDRLDSQPWMSGINMRIHITLYTHAECIHQLTQKVQP